MTVKILDAQLRDAYFHRLVGNMVNKYIGTEGTTRFPEALIKGFNVSFSDVEAKTYSTLMDPQAKAVFTSMVDIVNAGVESYIDKHGYNVEVPEGTPTNKAYQIAVEEIEGEFEGKNDSSELTGIKPDSESDPVGGDVSSIMKAMIDDLADRTSQDAKRVAETIIQMERERQDQLKAEDSESEAEGLIDSEEMSDEELDDIDELEAEDPNKKDDENPLEDLDVEEEVKKDDGKKDKKEEKKDEEDIEEKETEAEEEKDDDNPFSALESVLDEGPALESLEPGTEGVSRLLQLLTKKFLIKAAVGAIAGMGISYMAKQAFKSFNTQKMSGDEINQMASELEEMANEFREELKALVDEGGVAKAYADHYQWDFSQTPVFTREKADKKRFIAKVNFMNINNPFDNKPEGIDPDELKVHEKKIQALYDKVMNKGYAFYVDQKSNTIFIGYPKFIMETTPATESIEVGIEGIREVWQGLKRGLSTAKDIMSPSVEMTKSQIEELKRVSPDVEKEVKDKITALVKEANIEGLEVSYENNTWDIRDKFLNNYVVTLKIKTEGNHNKNELKALFGRIDGVCKEIDKDLNALNSVSNAKFGCGLVNLEEEDISKFYYGLTSRKKVVIVEESTESYFIVGTSNGKPVYGTESTSDDIPEKYKLYNLGLFMRGLREKSYSDMKEGFESSPMNGYVYTTYATESESPVILDGMLGFKAVEINKNLLDTSENFVVETVKLALKSARKFATEYVNKAELDPTNIGFKITKDNGIYTGYVTYKCNGLESIDSLCDNYGIESFESDLRKRKFIESIENYGTESTVDPAEKLFNDMKVGYAKLKVAGYNAFASESFIYEAYREQAMNEVGTEGMDDIIYNIKSLFSPDSWSRGWARFRKGKFRYNELKKPIEISKSLMNELQTKLEEAISENMSLFETEVRKNKFLNICLDNNVAYIPDKIEVTEKKLKDGLVATTFALLTDAIALRNYGFLTLDKDGKEVETESKEVSKAWLFKGFTHMATVVDGAISDLIKAYNKMILRALHKYPQLNKLGLSLEHLNDESYTSVDAVIPTGNGVTVVTSKKNSAAQMLNEGKNQLFGITCRKVTVTVDGTGSLESVESINPVMEIEYSYGSAMESLETRHSSDNRINTLAMRNNKLSYDKLRNIYDSVGQEVLNIKYSKKIACESANVEYIPNKGIVFSFEKLEPKEAISKMISRSKSFTGIESLALGYSNGVSKVILPIDLHAEACEGFSNVAKALRNYKEGLEMAKISNIADIAIESIDGIEIKPFKGLHKGQILKAATAYTTTMMEESLKEKFNRYGVESVEFKNAQTKYQDTTKKLALAIATTVTVLSRLGIECDLSMIRDPELFMNM